MLLVLKKARMDNQHPPSDAYRICRLEPGQHEYDDCCCEWTDEAHLEAVVQARSHAKRATVQPMDVICHLTKVRGVMNSIRVARVIRFLRVLRVIRDIRGITERH